jgi:ketosteroid isomerase-like protein
VWANYFADPTYQISWKTSSAEVVKDLGWTAGTFQDSSKGFDGKTVAKNGKYVCVWRKGADGKWKAIRDIWNYDGK